METSAKIVFTREEWQEIVKHIANKTFLPKKLELEFNRNAGILMTARIEIEIFLRE